MRREELILVGITAIWGSTFAVMKVGLESLPPFLFLAYRFGLASILMFAIFRGRLVKRESLKPGLILGITLFFGHGFQIVGLEYTSPSNSAFITSLYVVFTPFVAYFLLHERVRARDTLSLGIALTGLYLISGATIHLNHGDALTVVSALSFAFQIVLVESFRGHDYLSLTFWQIFWNFVLSTAVSVLMEKPVIPTAPAAWGGIIYLVVFATALTFTLQLRYQRFVPAYRAALIYSSEPIFASVVSLIALREVLSLKGYIGAALIMAGIWNEIRKGSPAAEPAKPL
ncbi:DMT family transporter [Thermococcus sp.]|uniref:DMT family transporter n=1 Tax=Thermococcus sp. TaxID=35749 RepID=UPI002620517C|nr:DMT family transporter [Thermococcus sp.]